MHISCLVKPDLLASSQQPCQRFCQQPRLQLVGAGPPKMVTLSWGLPARETSQGCVSLYKYMSPMRCVDPSRVSPQCITSERCGLRSLGAGFVLHLRGVKIVKQKERECVGMVSFSKHILSAQRLETNPHQSKEPRTRSPQR